jgi:hypothetical protein
MKKRLFLTIALVLALMLPVCAGYAQPMGPGMMGPGYGYGGGPGMMGPGYGYGGGPGMMGPGYGYGMGPGMMGPGYGYGGGPGMMGPGYGYGMGPGMMGRGYGGYGTGPGYGGQYGPRYQQPQKPLDEKQAREEAEDYLKSTRNPNLKVGKIQDKGDQYEVNIETKEGSLVDKILVDKDTGSMRSTY